MKEIKDGVQQNGTFLYVCQYLFSNFFVVGIGRVLNAIVGAFKLGSYVN